MYNYKISKQIDPKNWNSQLKNSDYATFFQTFEHLDSFLNPGESFPIFIQVFDDNNSIKAQLGLIIWESVKGSSSEQMNSLLNLFSKYSKRGSWVGGPIIFDQVQITRIKILLIILDALDEITKKYNLTILDGYSPVQDFQIDNGYLNEFKTRDFQIENFFSFVTDLEQPLEKIWDLIHNSTQRDVRKAGKRNIRVKELETFEELEEYFSLNKTWAKTKGMISKDFSSISKKKYFESILQGIEKIFLSYDGDELVAGHRLGCFNKIIYSHKVTNSYSKPTSIGGPILTWHAIEWAKENDFKFYDFSGGEMPPNDPAKLETYEKKWKSLLDYKRKWGGKEIPYYHFVRIKNDKNYKFVKMLSKIDLFYRESKRKRFSRPKRSSNK